MDDKIEIAFNALEFNTNANTDCGGFSVSWVCPDCGDRVSWAPSMWWDLKCCREWDFFIKVVGGKRF